MNERKLRKCEICGEWFNTTQGIMLEHYKLKHKFKVDKAFAIAELIMKRHLFLVKAKAAPFPESMTLTMNAIQCETQLSIVIAQSKNLLTGKLIEAMI